MAKKILASIIILSLLLFTLGCDKITAQQTSSSTGSSSSIIKTVELASKWQMNQMRIDVKASDELSLLLKLAPGDTADGYYYLEKGKNVNFKIMGSSKLYESKASENNGQVTSDRFSFTASQSHGTTYTLTFLNNTDTQITIFLELIYPATGSMYVPVK
jgi:hypothetical protein